MTAALLSTAFWARLFGRPSTDETELARVQAPALGAELALNRARGEGLLVLRRRVVGAPWARRWEVDGKVWLLSTGSWGTLDEVRTLDALAYAQRDAATQGTSVEAMGWDSVQAFRRATVG